MVVHHSLLPSEAAAVARHDEMMFRKFAFFFSSSIPSFVSRKQIGQLLWAAAFNTSAAY
jgi:hypothetical protein